MHSYISDPRTNMKQSCLTFCHWYNHVIMSNLLNTMYIIHHIKTTGRLSSSNLASPLHMVLNIASGDWCPCGDYRTLNTWFLNITVWSHDILQNRLSLCISPNSFQLADIPKMALKTPFGLFKYLRMPFCLWNAAQTFQLFIDKVLRGLNFCYANIDDLLIGSATSEGHKHNLQLVLEQLKEHRILINAFKYILGVENLDFMWTRMAFAHWSTKWKLFVIFHYPKCNTSFVNSLG